MQVPKIEHKPLFIISFLLFITVLSKPVMALYDVNNTGVSDVNGLTGSEVEALIGSNFGAVKATADTNNAYALFGNGNNIEIIGDFPVGGTIYAKAGNNGAYGLYSTGSVTTDNLNGTISAIAVNNYAYGLFSNNLLTIGDVNGTISASAYSDAYGLYSNNNSINVGIINGTITAIANTNSAYGLFAGTTIHTGNINGSISATAGNNNAYGLFANNSITTGVVNGIITASADSDTYGLRSLNGSITMGAINGTITATSDSNSAYGLSAGTTINTGNIDGSISATAGNNNAYGLFANNSITTGDVNGTITASAALNSYGLRSLNDSIEMGAITGTITATSDSNSAYGLSAKTTILTGNIDGSISAAAGNEYAYGLFANNSITTGDVNGTITASADSDAYGLRTLNDSITMGAITGTITATSDSNSAYGLSAKTTINTGNIDGSISATAGNEYAYGLFANNSITTGDVNGTITASADSDAYGLRSLNDSITMGAITGNITATSDSNSAYGLSAYSSITTEDINGVITVTAGNDSASGLSSSSGSITTGDINGRIYITASSNDASGLECEDSLTIGNINGTIDVATEINNNAYGLKSMNGPINVGDINGDIYAYAKTNGSYGIVSYGDQIDIGDIGGKIYARSDTNDAFGLYSYSDSLTIGEIKGNVWAYSAGEYAYGILSYGPMDITVNGGYIAGLADANNSTGAAIQSGRLDSHVLSTQNTDDNVEIVAGSRILGDIDLGMSGTDNDVLTLSGVDSNSTTLNDDLKNIETINLTGGTWHINGIISNNTDGIEMTGGVLKGTGTFGDLNVTDGTLAPGNSIGTTTIDGDLTLGTDSTLEIEVDNSGNSDKLLVTGDATINGGTLKTISTETISNTHEYTIIEANNVSGQFDVLDTALLQTILSDFSAGLGYESNSVILTVIPEQFDNSNFLMTANQISLGSALQQISDNGGNAVTTALQNVPTLEQVRDAYDQLCGQTRPSLASIASSGNTRFTETVSDRLNNTHSGVAMEFNDSPLFAMAQPDSKTSMYDTERTMNSFALGNGTKYFASEMWGLWMRGYGVFGERESKIESPGYQYRIYGSGFGMDYKCSEKLLLGVTGGYSYGTVDYSSYRDKSDITSMPIGIYGSWFTNSGYVDSIINYSSMKYETERYIDLTSEKLKGEFDGYETSAYLEAGRNWYYGKDFLIQPMASFQLSYLNLDSYSETGGVSALGFDEQSYKSYKGALGMKVKTHLGKYSEYESLTLELRGRWLHEFGDTESNINANFASDPGTIFKVSDEGLPRDTTVLGIGLKQINKQNMIYYIDYDTSINAEDTSHIISAGFRYRW